MSSFNSNIDINSFVFFLFLNFSPHVIFTIALPLATSHPSLLYLFYPRYVMSSMFPDSPNCNPYCLHCHSFNRSLYNVSINDSTACFFTPQSFPHFPRTICICLISLTLVISSSFSNSSFFLHWTGIITSITTKEQ